LEPLLIDLTYFRILKDLCELEDASLLAWISSAKVFGFWADFEISRRGLSMLDIGFGF
jgi:hypothetical protein